MRNFLVTGGAGFIGSNLTLALQERYPDARIVVVDDFRSGDFKNLCGFRGDFLAADVSRMDWRQRFADRSFDTIFHLASITDTTIHDQWLQTHDNVEGFRRILEFASEHQTPVVYASSAATYGICSGIQHEDQAPAPANIYAFTKVQLDNLARDYATRFPSWRLVGLRYFNVYGPREAHKKGAASMIYQLYCQMKAGKRPQVFRMGEQKRDFVSVHDVVQMTLMAANAPRSVFLNCGSGKAFSFNEVIAALNEALGIHLEPEYIDNPYHFYQPHTEANMGRAKEILGFVPAHTPHDGIKAYARWLESSPGAAGLRVPG